jgi:hypothetical protein
MTYTVEWTKDVQNGEVEEVEFFRSKPIDKRDLLVALDLQKELEKFDHEVAVAKEYRRWGSKFFVLGVILFLVGAVLQYKGNPFFRSTLSLSNLTDDGEVVGPITLSSMGRVYQIVLNEDIPKNSFSWVGAELVDSSYEAVNAVEGDFWHESGTDSEGYWEEANMISSLYFKLENPGDYYIRVFPEEGKRVQGNMTVSVYKNLLLFRYFILSACVALAYGGVLFFYRRVNPAFIILGIFTIGIFIIKNIEFDSD